MIAKQITMTLRGILILASLSVSTQAEERAPIDRAKLQATMDRIAARANNKSFTENKKEVPANLRAKETIGVEPEATKFDVVAEKKESETEESSNGLDSSDINLKMLAYSEATSFKVSKDTENCTVKKAGKNQPFDLTLKRSAAKLDVKSRDMNQSTMNAGAKKAEAFANGPGDKQINTREAAAMNDSTAKGVTVKSKFYAKLTGFMYNMASINSYLKDRLATKARKSCHSEVKKVSPSECNGNGREVVASLYHRDINGGVISSKDRSNGYDRMQRAVGLAGQCGMDDVSKKCGKYLKRIKKDIAFCKESLGSSSLKTSFIEFINQVLIETLYIKDAYAGSRESTFGDYGDAILGHIESDPKSNSQHFITNPYNRGSLSYSLAQAKKNADSGYDYLKKVQNENIDTNLDIIREITKNPSAKLTESSVLAGTDEFDAEVNRELAGLLNKEELSFKGVNQLARGDRSTLTEEFSLLGREQVKVSNLLKKTARVLADFENGKAFTDAGYERQRELVDNLPYIEKVAKRAKELAEQDRSDLKTRDGKLAYEVRDFSQDIKDALDRSNLKDKDLLAIIVGGGSRNLNTNSNKEDVKSGEEDEKVAEDETNATDKVTITKIKRGLSEKEVEFEFEGIVTDASSFDLMTDRELAIMTPYSLGHASIITRRDISLFKIISIRYMKTAPTRLMIVPESVVDRFNLSR